MPPAKKPTVDMTVPNRNNKFLSLVSLVTPFLLLPVVAIATGHVALKEYAKEGADQTWRPLALVGTISGYVVLFIKINLIFMVGSILMANATSHSMHDMRNQYYAYDMPMVQSNMMSDSLQSGDGIITFTDTASPDGNAIQVSPPVAAQ